MRYLFFLFILIGLVSCETEKLIVDKAPNDDLSSDLVSLDAEYSNLGFHGLSLACENLDSINSIIAESTLMFFDSLWIGINHPNFTNFNSNLDSFINHLGGLVDITLPQFISDFSDHFEISQDIVENFFEVIIDNNYYLTNLSSEEYDELFDTVICISKNSGSETTFNESDERIVRWALARWGGSWGADCYGQIVGGVIDAALYGAGMALSPLSGVGLGMAIVDTADAICECTGDC